MGLKLATNLNWVTGAVFLPPTIRLSPLYLRWLSQNVGVGSFSRPKKGSCATSQKTLMWTVPGPEEEEVLKVMVVMMMRRMRMTMSISISIVILSFTSEATCSSVELLAFAKPQSKTFGNKQGRSTDRDFSRHPKGDPSQEHCSLQEVYNWMSRECLFSRWFKVPFSSPSWRSLNPLKGSLNHPKKVTLNHQVPGFLKSSGTGAIIASPGATPALAVPGGYRFHWFLGLKFFNDVDSWCLFRWNPAPLGFAAIKRGVFFFIWDSQKNPPEMMKWLMFFLGWDILEWKVSGERELTAINW